MINKQTRWNPAIFRKNDIRGVYKKDFDLDFVSVLAWAFVDFYLQEQKKSASCVVKNGVVAVGHDARLSSPRIADYLIQSLRQRGVDICFLGLVPSPVCFFASYFVPGIGASVMVTASHNPPEFNGFKMALGVESVCDKKILQLAEFCDRVVLGATCHSGAGSRSEGEVGLTVPPVNDPQEMYVSFLKKRFCFSQLRTKHGVTIGGGSRVDRVPCDPQGDSQKAWDGVTIGGGSRVDCDPLCGHGVTIGGGSRVDCDPLCGHGVTIGEGSCVNRVPCDSQAQVKVVVDCGHGASGLLARRVFGVLNEGGIAPVGIHWLYAEPDGLFPNHHPDPSVESNLQDLKSVIQKTQSDFGVAFDGDGDRLVVVGGSGRVLHGDELMSIFISDILKRKAVCDLDSVVVDVKCGDWFFDFLKKQGLRTVIWKSGHSLIRQKTIEQKAFFGGELSGHFFFCDENYPIDDGLYGLLRLIEIVLRTGQGPEQLMAHKDTVETAEIRYVIKDRDEAHNKLKNLRFFYEKQLDGRAVCLNLIDGVRLSFLDRSWGLARLSNTQSEWTFRFGAKNQDELNKIQGDFYRMLDIVPKSS